jgi:CheY-like chemotaxis protein
MIAKAPLLLRPVQVLIVEDNSTDVYFIKEALKHSWLPMHFIAVEDGLKALDYLYHRGNYVNNLLPDLILLDLNLPKKNGLEVLLEIRMEPSFNPIPVVILTGSLDEEDARLAREKKAELYIVKPFDAAHFPVMVKAVENLMVAKFRP